MSSLTIIYFTVFSFMRCLQHNITSDFIINLLRKRQILCFFVCYTDSVQIYYTIYTVTSKYKTIKSFLLDLILTEIISFTASCLLALSSQSLGSGTGQLESRSFMELDCIYYYNKVYVFWRNAVAQSWYVAKTHAVLQ